MKPSERHNGRGGQPPSTTSKHCPLWARQRSVVGVERGAIAEITRPGPALPSLPNPTGWIGTPGNLDTSCLVWAPPPGHRYGGREGPRSLQSRLDVRSTMPLAG